MAKNPKPPKTAAPNATQKTVAPTKVKSRIGNLGAFAHPPKRKQQR